MEINRDAAVQLIFPSIATRGGRGGTGQCRFRRRGRDAVRRRERSGYVHRGASGNYDTQIAKVTAFFDEARQYQKEKTANLPGFKRDLKLEAMLPVLEGKVPVAVPAARRAGDSRRGCVRGEGAHQDRDHAAAGAGQRRAGAEGEEYSGDSWAGRRSCRRMRTAPYDYAESLPGEFYKAGVKIRVRDGRQRVFAQPAV